MTSVEDALSEIELFQGLPRKHLKKVADIVEVREVPGDHELIREGTYTKEFFMIFDGAAVISVRGRKRDSLGRGEFFGEIALLAKSMRSATVTSTTPMTLGVIGSLEFRGLLEKEPLITLHMLEVIARRFEALVVKPAGAFR